MPSVLSESLEQASTVFDETNSNTPKLLKMVRYGKVFYFNKASLNSGKTVDTKQLSLCTDVSPPSKKNWEKSPDFFF